MNRRGFLGALLSAAVLDPERLLWVPGKRKIFIPPLQIQLNGDSGGFIVPVEYADLLIRTMDNLVLYGDFRGPGRRPRPVGLLGRRATEKGKAK